MLFVTTLVIAWAEAGCGDDCLGEDLFGPGFNCGGRTSLALGEACWEGAEGSRSLHGVERHGLVWRGGLPCPSGSFCHPEAGCTPLRATGGTCEGLPAEVLWGACADAREACYPADPVDGDRTAGPRVCRALPTAEGAFCDAAVKADCDAPAPDLPDGARGGPQHAWLPLSAVDNPRWSGEGYLSGHLGVLGSSEWQYPVLRIHERVCVDQRCVRAPAPGAPCATLAPAATFPAAGPLAHICAQPPAFTVLPDTVGLGLGAVRDFSQAVLCVAGRCTPRAELSAGTCVAPDGADPTRDPTYCSDVAEACPGSLMTACLTPCRADGTCGQCRVCEHPDGTRTAVPDEAACDPGAGPWALVSPLLATPASAPLTCGYVHRTRFAPDEPVSGELWLEVAARGDFSDPAASLGIHVDGALVARWSPGRGCHPTGAYEPPATTAVRLDHEVLADGAVEVELRGSRALCARCLDPSGCRDRPDCAGNDATVTLSHRVRVYHGLTRDDATCQPR